VAVGANNNFSMFYAVGSVVPYMCTDNQSNYEIGYGTLTLSSGVYSISRTTIILSSNSNLIVGWPTTIVKDIIAWEGSSTNYPVVFTSNEVLDATNWGQNFIFTGGSSASVTFPSLSTVPLGYVVDITNSGSATLTINLQGGDTYIGSNITSLVPGQRITNRAVPPTGWSQSGSTSSSSGTFTNLTVTNQLTGPVGTWTSGGVNSLPVGATTASTGAFTTLSASGVVSGTGFTNLFASPPPVGSTVANTGNFTSLISTSVAVNGATLGTNKLAISGTSLLNGSVTVGSGTNTSFVVATPSSSVNFYTASGGTTGNGASLYANGSDTNVSNNLSTKGTGAHNFYTRNDSSAKQQFQVLDNTSGVSYATVTSGATQAELSTNSGGLDITPANKNVTINGQTPAPGYMNGFTLSNDGTTPNTVLDIAAGYAADSTNTVGIFGTTFTKTISGTWVAGSGSTGMGTGLTATASTWYHVFAIINNGSFDVYFDTSITAANKPTNTTAFRRIGSIKLDSSAHILAFSQYGKTIYWTSQVTDANALTTFTASTLLTLTVPPNLNVFPIISLRTTIGASVWSPLVGSTATNNFGTAGASFVSQFVSNTSSQLYFSFASTASTYTIYTSGWVDSTLADHP